jgi:hypothetical protein
VEALRSGLFAPARLVGARDALFYVDGGSGSGFAARFGWHGRSLYRIDLPGGEARVLCGPLDEGFSDYVVEDDTIHALLFARDESRGFSGQLVEICARSGEITRGPAFDGEPIKLVRARGETWIGTRVAILHDGRAILTPSEGLRTFVVRGDRLYWLEDFRRELLTRRLDGGPIEVVCKADDRGGLWTDGDRVWLGGTSLRCVDTDDTFPLPAPVLDLAFHGGRIYFVTQPLESVHNDVVTRRGATLAQVVDRVHHVLAQTDPDEPVADDLPWSLAARAFSCPCPMGGRVYALDSGTQPGTAALRYCSSAP